MTEFSLSKHEVLNIVKIETVQSYIYLDREVKRQLNPSRYILNLEEEVKNIDWLKDCVLCFDSMSIRKQIIWDSANNKYVGYVEGEGLLGDMDSSCDASLTENIV